MNKVTDINVAAYIVDKMIATLTIGVTITTLDYHSKIVIGNFCCDRCR